MLDLKEILSFLMGTNLNFVTKSVLLSDFKLSFFLIESFLSSFILSTKSKITYFIISRSSGLYFLPDVYDFFVLQEVIDFSVMSLRLPILDFESFDSIVSLFFVAFLVYWLNALDKTFIAAFLWSVLLCWILLYRAINLDATFLWIKALMTRSKLGWNNCFIVSL